MGSDRLYKELISKFKMTEGRRSQVVLLDERRLDILIQPKLYAGELLDMVASHFNLKEKDYFGLAYQDETGHHNWLQLDQRVLEHEFPKRNNQGQLTLYFLVKYFVESLSHLRDSATVEAFYLQAKSLVFKGTIEVDSETAFELAALVLQATHGDCIDEELAKSQLKKLPVLPTSAYREHPSISVCEEKVVEHYKTLAGQSRGSVIIKYLSVVEAQPTYGIHYYQVKDKGAIPWWLGLSQKGISQYDQTDRKTPRRVFLWKQLENLYFRDRKFSIEVHDHKRVVHALSSFNLYEDAIEEPFEDIDELSDAICDPTTQVSVSRRTFGPGNVTVYVWFASTPNLTKCIWSMAISQHKFYLTKKHNSKSQSTVLRNLGQIAAELTRSSQSLSSSSSTPNLSRSASSHSLPALKIEGEISDEAKAAQIAMLLALKAKKEALEEALLRKTSELKALCIQEGELTGELPPDTPLAPGENPPQVRRRVGTSFTVSDKLISSFKTKEEEVLAKLELDFEIQTKISSAAFKLANDVAAKKNVRRQRTITYQQAHVKLKEIEKKLVAARKQAEAKKRQMRQASDEEPSEDSISHSTDDSVSHDKVPSVTDSSPALHIQLEDANNHINRVLLTCSQRQSKSPSPAQSSSSSSLARQSGTCPSPVSLSAPPSPAKHHHLHSTSTPPPSPVFRLSSSGRTFDGQGYKPSSVYQTKLSYRSRHYPTLPLISTRYSNSSDYDNISTGSSSGLSSRSPYQNRFEANLNTEGSNLYSVPTQRTSQAFDSQDDTALVSPTSKVADYGLMSRHNSLDSMRRHTYQKQHYHHHHGSQPQSPMVTQSLPRSPLPSSISYDDRLRLVPSPHKHTECHNDAVGVTPAQHVHLQHQPSLLHHHHMHHMAYHHYQFHEKPERASSHGFHSSDLDGDFVDGLEAAPPKPRRTEEPFSNKHYGTGSIVTQRRPTVLPLSPRSPCSEEQQRQHLSITLLKPISIVHPHQWSQQSSGDSSPMLSPKPKSREWVETSLDSPIPARKSRSQLTSPHGEVVRPVSPRAQTPTHTDDAVVLPDRMTTIKSPVPSISYQNGVEVNVVSVGHFQPYWEETKPYELADFYKYSTKHRQTKSELPVMPTELQVPKPVESLNPLPISPRRPKVFEERWDRGDNGNSPKCVASRDDVANGATSPMGTSLVKSPSITSADGSFSFEGSRVSVADAFHEEMLAWYEDQENVKKATLV